MAPNIKHQLKGCLNRASGTQRPALSHVFVGLKLPHMKFRLRQSLPASYNQYGQRDHTIDDSALELREVGYSVMLIANILILEVIFDPHETAFIVFCDHSPFGAIEDNRGGHWSAT